MCTLIVSGKKRLQFPGKNDHHVMAAYLILSDKDLVSGQSVPTYFDKGCLLLSSSKLKHACPLLYLVFFFHLAKFC